MNAHLRTLIGKVRAARTAYAASRLSGHNADACKEFTELCFTSLPDILDALEAKHAEPSPATVQEVHRSTLGISPSALENVNFFLWIAMRTLSYTSMLLVFSLWFFTNMYDALSIGQTLGALVLFVVQAVVTFPDSILYERKDFEQVRKTKTPLFRFSSSLLMIVIALFQFAVLAYAVMHAPA
ncbi:MAG: hypothetical protein PHN64_09010 [Desulfovibrionaceae bacterium]|nr:hypothetical protein [Desulfovibrionaceae bacterium]